MKWIILCIVVFLLTIWGFTFYYPLIEAILLGQFCFIAGLVFVMTAITHFRMRKNRERS